MVLSLCQQKRFLACSGLRRRNNINDVDAEPAVKSEEKNRVKKVVRIRKLKCNCWVTLTVPFVKFTSYYFSAVTKC